MNSRPVRVRFAPSPTGFLHVGGLRTVLYNWFFARRHQGTFILRIEDTDRTRFVPGAIEKLCQSLARVGIVADEGFIVKGTQEDGTPILEDRGPHAPYLQSQRREKHLEYAYELIERDAAYYCFCSPERLEEMAKEQAALKQPQMYDRKCRSLSKQEAENRAAVGDAHTIRLKVPLEGSIELHDLIRGDITIPWSQVDDQVLIKSDGYPTYHLAATSDDHDMEISHVIRGEEWISSLPKHVFIAQAMGWNIPEYAHVPLLLNPDRSKLSKRQGDVAVEDYLAKGYLPEALVNFVALLGWNPTSDREIFSKDELASLFEIEKVNKSGAIFNTEKLDWLNAHYIKELSEDLYLAHAAPYVEGTDLTWWGPNPETFKKRATLMVRDRLAKFSDLPELIRPWIQEQIDLDPALLIWKTQTPEEVCERLAGVREVIATLTEQDLHSMTTIEFRIKDWIQSKGWGNGEVLWPLRVALSGAKQSPSPFELLYLLGKERALARIDQALAKIS